ncbi:MAG: hypothetical protein H0T46_18280 [Deltaproteobacteria bacterium]|nr:hypothetical protein [Deltaproteobacteria bacterium]
MLSKTKVLAAALAFSVVGAVSGCSTNDEGTDRWATTQNTNVAIDWDKVNEAYKLAEGPEDLEKRINEIYEGDEIISIAVHDQEDKTQIVTGFFDKNTDGKVDEPEKIFTMKRVPSGEGGATVQTTGHGAYYGYHSPMMSIMTGMLMGHMLSSMFMPGYSPMYRQGYTTPASRVSSLGSQRASHRAANPGKYSRSNSGRSYGSPSSSGRSSGGGRSGGGRFGLSRAGRTVRPTRLTA